MVAGWLVGIVALMCEMDDYEILKGKSRRLDRAIEIAVMRNDFDLLRTLVIVRDGSIYGQIDRRSNTQRLHDKERSKK